MFGDTLVKEIAQRKELTKRLEQAEVEYQQLIDTAHAEKEQILATALAHKADIIQEAKDLAKKEYDTLVEQAHYDADHIVQKAQKEADLKLRDLDAHFVEGVKTTSMALIKKLFVSTKSLQESYVEGLVQEFSSSYKK